MWQRRLSTSAASTEPNTASRFATRASLTPMLFTLAAVTVCGVEQAIAVCGLPIAWARQATETIVCPTAKVNRIDRGTRYTDACNEEPNHQSGIYSLEEFDPALYKELAAKPK